MEVIVHPPSNKLGIYPSQVQLMEINASMVNISTAHLEGATSTPIPILRNSIYVTFNAPQVDEYHRSIFITHPSTRDGTLFHAKYDDHSASWACERREVGNLSKARSLVLLYRLGSMPIQEPPLDPDTWFQKCEDILKSVNMDPTAKRDDDVVERLGNPVLGGYSCIVWSVDAVARLANEGLVELNGLSPEMALMKARLIAGPEDGKAMAGKDHGPLRVLN